MATDAITQTVRKHDRGKEAVHESKHTAIEDKGYPDGAFIDESSEIVDGKCRSFFTSLLSTNDRFKAMGL